MNLLRGISLIKMDVEGEEVSILNLAQRLIQDNKPVLAICAYHKPEDLLKIPETINNICGGYSF